MLLILAAIGTGYWVIGKRAQVQRQRALCASHLSQLGKAISTFADSGENLGRVPMTLRALHPAYIQDPRLFSCPSWSAESQASSPASAQSGDYLYFPNHTKSQGAAPLALCPHCGAGLGFNVLQGDGHVEWFATTPDQLETKLVKMGVPLRIERGMSAAEIQDVQTWRARLNLPPADPPEPLE